MQESAFDGLLPAGAVVVETRNPTLWEASLLPEEQMYVAYASDKRRREFSAGRSCARTALKILGLPAVVIPVGTERQPLFPSIVSGSITHTEGYCAAAVARRGAIRSLGIDAETDAPMDDEIARLVLGEREHFELQSCAHLGNINVLAFGLKEAFYKAAFPLCQRYIDFQEVAVRISDAACKIALLSPLLVMELAGLEIVARFRFADQRVYCAVTLTHREC